MRLSLIPIRRAGIVVASVIGVTVLNGHSYGFVKCDRVYDVVSIQGHFAAPVGPAA